MFWHAIQQGLSVLLHWQTYVAMFEFVAIMMAPNLLFGLAITRYPQAAAIGCFLPIVQGSFQTLAVFVFVMTLAPIIFGGDGGAAWTFPWAYIAAAPGIALRMLGMLFVIGVVLAFVRLFLFGNAIMGCFVLAGLASAIGDHFGIQGPAWPGFWFAVGVLVISGVLFYMGILLTFGITALMGENGAALGQLVAQPISGVLMFLPVFIYGGWLLQGAHT